MLIAGFSGTRKGMTARQKSNFKILIKYLHINEFHHGDCIGADKEAHELILMSERAITAITLLKIVIHPPVKSDFRANCHTYRHSDFISIERREPEPYQERNQAIVNECDVLILAPKTFEPYPHSGTWSTYTRAKRNGKPVIILWP